MGMGVVVGLGLEIQNREKTGRVNGYFFVTFCMTQFKYRANPSDVFLLFSNGCWS
jgi:hypothetical protein